MYAATTTRPYGIPSTARVEYAVIRNASGGSISVRGELGTVSIASGERKTVAYPNGSLEVLIINGSTGINDGEVTADIGLVY